MPVTVKNFLRAFIIIAIVTVSIIGAIVIWLFQTRLSSFSVLITSLNLQAKVKILVGFYQVMSSFELVYVVSIDGKLKAWFDFCKVLSLDFMQIVNVPTDYIGAGSKKDAFVLNACWPYPVRCANHLYLLVLYGDSRKIERNKINRHMGSFWNEVSLHRYCSLLLCSTNRINEYIRCKVVQIIRNKRCD